MKIKMLVKGVFFQGHSSFRYELSSAEEKYGIAFILHVNQAYKPDWKPGEQLVMELPDASEPSPPLPQRLKEVAG